MSSKKKVKRKTVKSKKVTKKTVTKKRKSVSKVKKSVVKPKKLKRLPKGKELHVFSDFDETMLPVNAAGRLIAFYLAQNPHHEPFHRRVQRISKLLTPSLRRKNFEEYYECLRRIPAKDRHNVLAKIPVNQRWLRAVKDLRMEYRAQKIGLTILSRNCLDVIHEWIMQNREMLRQHNIEIEGIIANRSLDDKNIAFVRERADLKHVDYVGFGQLLEKQKKLFLDKHSIYIGDHDDEVLRSVVHEFIRV